VTVERWRFIDSGPMPGADNMALDEAMFEAHAAGAVPPTLRVYTWRPWAVSLGRFQRVEGSIDLEACRRLGIDVVRRPTGGRAILHTAEEVTFGVVVSAARLGTTGIMDSYRALAAAIAAGLKLLGLDARLVERRPAAGAQPSGQDPACFAVKARCDLVVGAAKLVGSAQVQREGVILQQNSLPLRIDLTPWADVFVRSGPAPEATGLWDAAHRQVLYGEVASALRQGFAATFAIDFEDSEPTAEEQRRARQRREERAILDAGTSSG
jgi:lipoate-protein ligase A